MSLRRFVTRLRGIFQRERISQELDEEIRAHLEMDEADRHEAGARTEDARPAALATFGNVTLHQEDARAAWSFPRIESFWQDIRYAVRVLSKQPGFTVVAVLTLALGIGANTAIFSLVDTVMLRMPPVQRPQELLQVTMSTPNFGNGARTSFTNPLWEELRDHQDIFSGVFAWGTDNFNLAQSGLVENVRGLYASGGYFTTLGVRPAVGRLFTANDDKRGCRGVAVLSYGFWQEHFGSVAAAIGGTIPISGHPFQVIGVSAPGFFGTNVGSSFDVAVPICAEAILAGKDSSLDRTRWWLRVIGRPKPGISPEQAAARLAVLSPPTFAATVPANWKPAQQQSYKSWTFLTVPGATGISSLRSQYDLPLKMLMAIAGLVLLIACANVASLMLARASSRGKEIAVRLALGASRLRLVRQLLTESVLLSVSGGVLGILFAQWGSHLLVRQISAGQENVFLDLALDGRVLAFTAGIAVLTGLLFGMLPALRSTRVSLSGSMKGSAAENGARDARFRSGRWTVAAQVAISLVLVVTAGLFVRSFRNLVTLDAGFDRSNVLVVDIDLHNSNVPDAEFHAVSDEMLRHIRALPGVMSASQAVVAPIGSRTEDDQIIVDDSQRADRGGRRSGHQLRFARLFCHAPRAFAGRPRLRRAGHRAHSPRAHRQSGIRQEILPGHGCNGQDCPEIRHADHALRTHRNCRNRSRYEIWVAEGRFSANSLLSLCGDAQRSGALLLFGSHRSASLGARTSRAAGYLWGQQIHRSSIPHPRRASE